MALLQGPGDFFQAVQQGLSFTGRQGFFQCLVNLAGMPDQFFMQPFSTGG